MSGEGIGIIGAIILGVVLMKVILVAVAAVSAVAVAGGIIYGAVKGTAAIMNYYADNKVTPTQEHIDKTVAKKDLSPETSKAIKGLSQKCDDIQREQKQRMQNDFKSSEQAAKEAQSRINPNAELNTLIRDSKALIRNNTAKLENEISSFDNEILDPARRSIEDTMNSEVSVFSAYSKGIRDSLAALNPNDDKIKQAAQNAIKEAYHTIQIYRESYKADHYKPENVELFSNKYNRLVSEFNNGMFASVLSDAEDLTCQTLLATGKLAADLNGIDATLAKASGICASLEEQLLRCQSFEVKDNVKKNLFDYADRINRNNQTENTLNKCLTDVNAIKKEIESIIDNYGSLDKAKSAMKRAAALQKTVSYYIEDAGEMFVNYQARMQSAGKINEAMSEQGYYLCEAGNQDDNKSKQTQLLFYNEMIDSYALVNLTPHKTEGGYGIKLDIHFRDSETNTVLLEKKRDELYKCISKKFQIAGQVMPFAVSCKESTRGSNSQDTVLDTKIKNYIASGKKTINRLN